MGMFLQTKIRSIDNILTKALKRIESVVGKDNHIMINMHDYHDDKLICQKISLFGEFKPIESTYADMTFNIDDTPHGECFKYDNPNIVDEDTISDCSNDLILRFHRWSAKQLVMIPIVGGKKSIGTVLIFSPKVNKIQIYDAVKISKKLTKLSKAIAFAWKYHLLEMKEEDLLNHQTEKMQFLEFVSKTNSLTSLGEIVENFSQEIFKQYNFNIINVFLPSKNELFFKYGVTAQAEHQEKLNKTMELFKTTKIPLDQYSGAQSVVYLNNDSFYIENASKIRNLPMADADRQTLEIYGNICTIFAFPIRYLSEPIGVFYMFSLGEVVELSKSDKEYLNLLGSYMGGTLVNGSLYTTIENQKTEIETLNEDLEVKNEELEKLATTDKLTGMKNFAYIEEELARCITHIDRNPERELSVLLLDIDHFKKFNDRFGHINGNVALKTVASIILENIRSMDIGCRYGGEEFVVILPEISTEQALMLAERIRRFIEQTEIVLDNCKTNVTISIGVAQYKHNQSIPNFLECADKALYEAKDSGRNCVKCESDIKR